MLISEKKQDSHFQNEVESIFSVDEEINKQTLCVLQLSNSDTEPSQSESDSDLEQEQGQAFQMNAINMAQKVPMIKMKVIPSKYANPIRVVAFFDTGASYSIMNPDILPSVHWKKKKQFFHTANGEVFCTNLISKPIKLEFLPGCSLFHRIIRSKLPSKDLIIGFDLYIKKQGLKILPHGLAFKQYFTAWETILNYFQLHQNPY